MGVDSTHHRRGNNYIIIAYVGSNHEIALGDLAKFIGETMGASVPVICDHERLRTEKSEVTV